MKLCFPSVNFCHRERKLRITKAGFVYFRSPLVWESEAEMEATCSPSVRRPVSLPPIGSFSLCRPMEIPLGWCVSVRLPLLLLPLPLLSFPCARMTCREERPRQLTQATISRAGSTRSGRHSVTFPRVPPGDGLLRGRPTTLTSSQPLQGPPQTPGEPPPPSGTSPPAPFSPARPPHQRPRPRHGE